MIENIQSFFSFLSKEVEVMDIKIKLLELNKKQVDLLDAVRKRGYPKLDPSVLSKYINGRAVTPQSKSVLALCENILAEWSTE